MAVEVDAHAGPVQAAGDLLDMGGFPGTVIALDHDAAVIAKTGEDREGGVGVEFIGAVEFWHAIGALGKALDRHVGVDAEDFAD